MEHLKITSLRPAFKIYWGNEHERKSRKTRPRAVDCRGSTFHHTAQKICRESDVPSD